MARRSTCANTFTTTKANPEILIRMRPLAIPVFILPNCWKMSKKESFAATATASRTLDTHLHSSDKLDWAVSSVGCYYSPLVPFEIVGSAKKSSTCTLSPRNSANLAADLATGFDRSGCASKIP
eukprot:IDg3612t1